MKRLPEGLLQLTCGLALFAVLMGVLFMTMNGGAW